MKLYFHPLSTYSQKALIAFYEKGVPFEPQIVSLFDPAARAEYEKMYPLGKIPSLVRDDGWFIPESTIIIEYLDGYFPEMGQRLIAADRDQARQARFMDRMLDNYVNNTFVKIFFDARQPAADRDPRGVAAAKSTLDKMYAYMERQLAERTWLLGDQFSLAECAAAPPLGYLRNVYPFTAFPSVVQYWQRLEARPSVARVLAEAAPHFQAMMAAGSPG